MRIRFAAVQCWHDQQRPRSGCNNLLNRYFQGQGYFTYSVQVYKVLPIVTFHRKDTSEPKALEQSKSADMRGF